MGFLFDSDDLRQSRLISSYTDVRTILLIEHVLQLVKIVNSLVETLLFAGDSFEHCHVNRTSESGTIVIFEFGGSILNCSGQGL